MPANAPRTGRKRSRRRPRAWQRMLSGRRLDLLDPSPLDVEIEDIAHGLARVARWNGQTAGAHIFSVAQHSLLVEAIARQRAPRSTAGAACGPAARCARIRDRRHDLAVQGGDRRRLQGGRSAAARGDPSALRPAGRCCRPSSTALIKAADRAAAYLEATRLAGFAAAEARRFFGPPPQLSAAIERDYLTPWPAETAEARYLERFAKLAGD